MKSAPERRSRINLYLGPKLTISRDELPALEATGDYVFEEKKDGFWCLVVVEGGVITSAISRTGLEFEGVEVAGIVGLELRGSGRVVGELTADPVNGEKCGARRLHLFDILDWNGIDLRDLSQVERREALSMIYEVYLKCDVVHLVEQRETGIAEWFDEILARGGEGVVAKKRGTRYRAANGDGKIESWLRAKKKRTIDYVVVGCGEAAKGTPNLALGLWKRGALVKIIDCTLPSAWRRLPAQSYIGKVVEAEGWEVFPSGALRSAQLGHRSGPRADKRPEECTLEAALLA